MKKLHLFILALFALAATSAGIWLGQTTSRDSTASIKPDAIQGAIYPIAKILNNFELVDQDSQKITKADFLNHWSLVFVGYTHCPDVCPTTMAVMNQVSQFMRDEQIQPPRIIFLSIDPERDTVEVLKPYVAYFNQDFIGLTGSLKEVTQLSQQLNAVFRKAPGASGKLTDSDYLMDHSSALMLINPDGNLQSILTAPHTPGNIIDSILKSQAYYEVIKN